MQSIRLCAHKMLPAALALAALAALASAPALAAINTPLTVTLIAPGGAQGPGFVDPTPVNASQSFATASSVISLASGGGVGTFLLPSERIALSGNAIHISSYLGDDTGGVFSTGWLGLGADSARYEFNGLAIAGHKITGYTMTLFDGFAASGFVGLVPGTSAVSFVDTNADGSLDKLSFNLDSLRFVPRAGVGNSEYHADFRIELIAAAVPETSTVASLLAGLAGLAWVTKRRAQKPTAPAR